MLTRNPQSPRAKELSLLPNVTTIQGSQTNQDDLHRAFQGVWGAWVNTDGFTIGEKNETFYGIRAYEIPHHHGVQHYVYAATDYAVKDVNWDDKYHWGHNDAKGRVADFILAQKQDTMRTSVITTGPYMDMLFDGMFTPEGRDDGSVVWANPASTFLLSNIYYNTSGLPLTLSHREWKDPAHCPRRRGPSLALAVGQSQ